MVARGGVLESVLVSHIWDRTGRTYDGWTNRRKRSSVVD